MTGEDVTLGTGGRRRTDRGVISTRESSARIVTRMSPQPIFNAVLHEPNRLQICAYLVPFRAAEFAAVRDHLGLSDSALSKHLKTLESSGYTALLKESVDGHLRTRVSLTPEGREALCCHVAEIQRMARIVSTRPRTGPLTRA